MFRSVALASLMAISGCMTISAQEVAPAAPTAPEAQQIEGIEAVVNDDPISLSLGGQQPTPEQVQQITTQALEQLIDEKLQ